MAKCEVCDEEGKYQPQVTVTIEDEQELTMPCGVLVCKDHRMKVGAAFALDAGQAAVKATVESMGHKVCGYVMMVKFQEVN